jgi:predicted MFS family arabinose efflux permease
MLAPYRDILRIPGAARFSAIGLLARLPTAMMVLSIILFVSAETDSYAIAGAMTAAFQISASTVTILSSRVSDRLGQSRVLPVLCTVNALFIIGFVVSMQREMPVFLSGALIAVAGAFMPSIGSMIRARWAHITDGERLRTAFAMESTLDEIDWTVGPLLTAVLAAALDPAAPLIAVAVLTLIFGLALASLHSTQPTPKPPQPRVHRSGLMRDGLPVVVLTLAGVGIMFGAYEVAVPAFAREQGAPNASGIVLAAWAVGSMIGGLWFGTRTWQVSLPRQAQVAIGLMALAVLPGMIDHSITVSICAAFVAGVAIAPSLITQFSLAERLVPADRITEGITWAMSGITLGFAAGSALAGALIDAVGVRAGFAVSVVGAVFAFVLAWSFRSHLERHVRQGEEPPVFATGWDPVPGPTAGSFDSPDSK